MTSKTDSYEGKLFTLQVSSYSVISSGEPSFEIHWMSFYVDIITCIYSTLLEDSLSFIFLTYVGKTLLQRFKEKRFPKHNCIV
jgi:hypothetical protein